MRRFVCRWRTPGELGATFKCIVCRLLTASKSDQPLPILVPAHRAPRLRLPPTAALYMPVYGEMKHALLAAQAPLASAVVASATAATVLVSLVEVGRATRPHASRRTTRCAWNTKATQLLSSRAHPVSFGAHQVPVEALLLRVKSGRAASGFLSAAKSALSSPGGIASLYCGAGPFIARHVLYESLEFLAYETLRARALAKKRLAGPLHAGDGSHSAGLAPSEAAVMAFAAATVATVASQPLDCIRVACSLSAGGAAHAHAAHAAASGGLTAVGALQSIIRAKGPAGLFSGLLPRLATLAPGAVIFFSTYEATRAASLRIRGGLAASSGAAPAHAGVAEEAPVAAGPTNVMSSATTVDAVASEALAVAAGHSVAAEPVLALACAAKQTTRR